MPIPSRSFFIIDIQASLGLSRLFLSTLRNSFILCFADVFSSNLITCPNHLGAIHKVRTHLGGRGSHVKSVQVRTGGWRSTSMFFEDSLFFAKKQQKKDKRIFTYVLFISLFVNLFILR